MPAAQVELVDPFDLPEWLGARPVTWAALSGVRGAARVTGSLRSDGDELACDLMAADLAFPVPLLPEDIRRHAHQAWQHGQVLLVRLDGRLTLAVPGTAYSADGALETVGRLAKAVGAPLDRFTVALQL